MKSAYILLTDWLPTTWSKAIAALTLGTAPLAYKTPSVFPESWLPNSPEQILLIRLLLSETSLLIGSLFTFLLVVRHYSIVPKIATPTAFLFEDGELKWKVTDYKNGKFSVDEIPYCKTHDIKFMLTPAGQFMCPEVIGSNCKSRILDHDEPPFLLSFVKPKAELNVCKYETKP